MLHLADPQNVGHLEGLLKTPLWNSLSSQPPLPAIGPSIAPFDLPSRNVLPGRIPTQTPVRDCTSTRKRVRRRRVLGMRVLLRRLAVPANDSQLGLALGLSLILMALLLCGVLWQSNIILFQRDLIRDLWSARFAG
jgi:hypothetical protein